MPKLQELLATPPASFVKDADVESPDEAQLEQDFANMAFVFLRDRAQALMPYLLGFEVVDREEDGSRAVGIFGFKIADKYYYVPAFFVNNQVKGMDLLYSKETNSFLPLRETWINHILNKSTLRLGEGTSSDKVREDFEQPNFRFLAEPPVGVKSAGLAHLFTEEELKNAGKEERDKRDGTGPYKGSYRRKGEKKDIGRRMESGEECPEATDKAHLFTEEELKNAGKEERAKRDGTGPYKGSYRRKGEKKDIGRRMESGEECPEATDKAATDAGWRADVQQAFEAWNDLQKRVVDDAQKDAAFQQAWAGAIASMKHEPLEQQKTADDSPLISYLQQHGGPQAVGALLRSLQEPKYANAFLSFYPDIKTACVSSFSPDLAPKQAASRVTVVSEESPNYPCETALTDEERMRVVRDGFAIVDRRDSEDRSQLIDTEFEARYTNPTVGGRYDVLLPTGSTVQAWVLPATAGGTGKGLLCVEPEKKLHFTARPQCVFVRGDAVEGESAYDAAVPLGEMEVGKRYALVNDKDEATAPMRISRVVAENGERVRVNVHCYESLDHDSNESGTWDRDVPVPYADELKCLQLADFEGSSLRRSGDKLIVPSNWKALPLKSKWDDPDVTDAYDAFTPGNLTDLGEALHKNGIHHITVEASDQGLQYSIRFDDFAEGPFNAKRTMVQLATKYGMHPDDAEMVMRKAATNIKSRHLIKLGQLVGVSTPLPSMPGMGSEDVSGLGLPLDEPYAGVQEGTLLGAPTRQDSTVPGFAVGGQSETEAMGGDAMMLAEQAAMSGQKNVFDHASIGGLARMYDASAAIDMYLPELMKSLDRVGRILFIFYWKNEDFSERYGSEDLAEMEDLLRGVFKSFGDLVLKLKQKAIMAEDGKDVLSI